ncbi:MAG TPA: hypothetical protein VJ866_16070 [Pyrinomonadaceae bacterium]|nr:hypothetical protein [Pyrinomonadaceae bacterium]
MNEEAVEARDVVKPRIQQAAQALNTADPVHYVGPLIDRWLPGPMEHYAANTLTPGAVPCEPSFSEMEPQVLRFTIEPLGPHASPVARRDEVTRANRGYVQQFFGRDALRWFDRRSEEWRGMNAHSRLNYGAWFGTAYDHDGLSAAKVYYELVPEQLDALPGLLRSLVHAAVEVMPTLVPIFTSIRCGRTDGSQRVTFLHRGPLRVNALGPLMGRMGLGHQLPGFMQVVGLSLGGRFDLPERSVLLGLRETGEGPEVKLEVLLGMLPDLPPNFLGLLMLGLAERPLKAQALGQWLWAFTPESQQWPGRFSVLSIRATPRTPARVSLYLRPTEFEVHQRLSNVARMRAANGVAA